MKLMVHSIAFENWKGATSYPPPNRVGNYNGGGGSIPFASISLLISLILLQFIEYSQQGGLGATP